MASRTKVVTDREPYLGSADVRFWVSRKFLSLCWSVAQSKCGSDASDQEVTTTDKSYSQSRVGIWIWLTGFAATLILYRVVRGAPDGFTSQELWHARLSS